MKPKIRNQDEFDSFIDRNANLLLEEFKKVFDNKKHKDFQKNTFLLKLSKRSYDLESDPNFAGVFTGIRDIDLELDKDQPYFVAIEKYIERSKRDRNEIIYFLIEYNATIKARELISDYWGNATKEPGKNLITEIKTLNSVFVDCSEIENYLKALREVDTPIIDKANNYLLGERQKGSIVAWVDVLKLRGKMKNLNRKKLSELLNNNFLGLNISSRTFGNINTTAYKKYYKKLTALIR